MSRPISFVHSIRFRLSVLYSSVVFGLAGAILGVTYYFVRRNLRRLPLTLDSRVMTINGRPVLVQNVDIDSVQLFYQTVTQRALTLLSRYSVIALIALFLISFVVGWIISGRALRPVVRITAVAKEITASDLSRRISYGSTGDELSRLAETFDDMLERLDTAFSAQRRFLADTSHDLRTPLAIIRSNIDVLATDPSASLEDWQVAGGIVQRNAERMADMIDDLLAAARLEVRSAVAVHINLADLVAEAADELSARGAAAGVTIESRPGSAQVEGVPSSLRRAIENLADNALKASPPGGRVVLASGVDTSWAWVAVTDEGQGIDTSALEKAGRRGLGLAIVRQIVEAHGGSVEAYRGRDSGSVLVIWLPLTDEPGAPPSESPLRKV